MRIERRQRVSQIPAVHVRHDHVGDEQTDVVAMLVGQLDRGVRRLRGEHAVAQALERPRCHLQDRLFVLDEQHRLAAARPIATFASLPSAPFSRSRVYRGM